MKKILIRTMVVCFAVIGMSVLLSGCRNRDTLLEDGTMEHTH